VGGLNSENWEYNENILHLTGIITYI